MESTIITPGWEIAEDLSQNSGLVELAAGGLTEVLSILIPSGSRLLIESLTARVVDAGSDQVSFSVVRNGASVLPGASEIPGSLFDYTASFGVQRDAGPGLLTVRGTNTSAGPIRAIASLKCFRLRETKKRERTERYLYEGSEVQ